MPTENSMRRWHVQAKKEKIFKDLPNVCDIVDDIVIVVSDVDGKDYDKMQVCQRKCKALQK